MLVAVVVVLLWSGYTRKQTHDRLCLSWIRHGFVVLDIRQWGRGVYSVCAWPQSYDHTPSHPYHAGTEHVGFHQPGKQCLHEARSAVRCLASRMKGELHPPKNRS